MTCFSMSLDTFNGTGLILNDENIFRQDSPATSTEIHYLILFIKS